MYIGKQTHKYRVRQQFPGERGKGKGRDRNLRLFISYPQYKTSHKDNKLHTPTQHTAQGNVAINL